MKDNYVEIINKVYNELRSRKEYDLSDELRDVLEPINFIHNRIEFLEKDIVNLQFKLAKEIVRADMAEKKLSDKIDNLTLLEKQELIKLLK